MKHDPADADLHARFSALRKHDEALAPPFTATLARTRPQPPKPRPQPAWRYGVAAGALAAVLLTWFQAPAPHPQAEPDPALPLAWPVPTDGLLNRGSAQADALAWGSLPTTALGQPSFSRYPEDR